jgi:soluble lytic murein transglycosylase
MFRRRIAPLLLLSGLTLGLPGAALAEVYAYTDSRGVLHFADTPRHAGFKLRPDPGRPLERPRQYDGIIVRAGESHGVAPGLVKAVVHAESNFKQRAVSAKGAQGLMQLMPETARSLGLDDPFDPWQNIFGGTQYLGNLIQRYSGDLNLALAAYNAGASAVAHYGGVPPYQETRGYVKRVLSLYRRYDADFR